MTYNRRSDESYEDEMYDLYLERQARLRYERTLARHPHPQDPDHPDEPEENEI
jgi:hypothetical protein